MIFLYKYIFQARKNNLGHWIFIISITLYIIFMPYNLCMITSILNKFPLKNIIIYSIIKHLFFKEHTNIPQVNFQMFKLDLEKAEESEIKLPTSLDHRKSRVSEKHLFLLYWLCQSLWLVDHNSCGTFFKRREYQTTWAASCEMCMQVKKQQLELNME